MYSSCFLPTLFPSVISDQRSYFQLVADTHLCASIPAGMHTSTTFAKTLLQTLHTCIYNRQRSGTVHTLNHWRQPWDTPSLSKFGYRGRSLWSRVWTKCSVSIKRKRLSSLLILPHNYASVPGRLQLIASPFLLLSVSRHTPPNIKNRNGHAFFVQDLNICYFQELKGEKRNSTMSVNHEHLRSV